MKTLYKFQETALAAAKASGKYFYQSSADDRSNLNHEYINGDNDWNNLCWSGEVGAYRTDDGDIFAWWEC